MKRDPMRRESHTCVAEDARRYREIATNDLDRDLLRKMNDWREFKVPLGQNIRIWRLFCGIVRREAYRRGIWAPE